MEVLILVYAFVIGAIVGSFLNVCIHRMPEEQSIVFPGSHCPQCKKPIAWYDNIPLVSFLWLRAKCRHCGKRISVIYFAVELVTGLIWLWFFWRFGLTWFSAAGVLLFSMLFALSIIDLQTGLLPDLLTLPGMVLGMLLSAAVPALQGQTVWYAGLLQSFLGLIVGGGILLMTGLLGNIIFKKESMGGGDIKLLAMMGAFLGMKDIVFVFFMSPIIAIPFALFAKLVKKDETIPFGPYLALAGAAFFLYGDQIFEALFPMWT